jgi:hypothetical protein
MERVFFLPHVRVRTCLADFERVATVNDGGFVTIWYLVPCEKET